MSIAKRIGPRPTPPPTRESAWISPKLKDAVLIETTNGSMTQVGENIAIRCNAGAGPYADSGVFASWKLEDVLGHHVTRHVNGLSAATWIQRMGAFVEAGLTSGTDVFCSSSTGKDLKAVPNMLGPGIR